MLLIFSIIAIVFCLYKYEYHRDLYPKFILWGLGYVFAGGMSAYLFSQIL